MKGAFGMGVKLAKTWATMNRGARKRVVVSAASSRETGARSKTAFRATRGTKYVSY